MVFILLFSISSGFRQACLFFPSPFVFSNGFIGAQKSLEDFLAYVFLNFYFNLKTEGLLKNFCYINLNKKCWCKLRHSPSMPSLFHIM